MSSFIPFKKLIEIGLNTSVTWICTLKTDFMFS